MESRSFYRLAAMSAILAGISGFLYAVSFIILRDVLLSALFLTLTGIFTTSPLVAVYHRVSEASPAPALWGLLLAFTAALGTTIHGGYDLANAIQVPATELQPVANLPSQIDPRGLLTFGIMGIGLFTISWLIGRSPEFSRGLAYLGYLSAILLVLLYLSRLIVLNPASPVILAPALLNGFLVGPIWYVWLGVTLLGLEREGEPAIQPQRRVNA